MRKNKKRIGLITSGGDCAGLNAAIYGVVQAASGREGWDVIGVRYGTRGLYETPFDIIELTPDTLPQGMLHEGSTMLGSTNSLSYPLVANRKVEHESETVAALHALKLDALICVGGDGTIRIIQRICKLAGLPLVAIPKTIDNDVNGTEHALGFNSAVAVATEAIQRLRPTARGHQRVIVLEVMGRDAGHLALASGIAGGADAILLPEIPWSLDKLAAHIEGLWSKGQRHAIIVASEAIHKADGNKVHKTGGAQRKRYGGVSEHVAEDIEKATGRETRSMVLGHVQRGCEPTWTDRVLGQVLGVHAVDLLVQNRFDRLVLWQDDMVVDIAIEKAASGFRSLDINSPLLHTARRLGICLGD